MTAALPLSARAVAPDLARGVMLLLIALANVHLFLLGTPGIRGYPAELDPADRVVTLVQTLLVDGRAYPLFALLMGYGAVQSARRREADQAVGILRRRGGWMVAIGAVHGLALFPGDIVGAYGLLLVLLAGVLVRGTTVTLGTIAVIGIALTATLGTGSGLPTGLPVVPSVATQAVGTALGQHVGEWLTGALGSALLTAGMVALGALAARHRLLDEPDRHRPLLRRTALVGLVVAVVGGLPLALEAAGWWRPGPALVLVAGSLHALGGLAGGAGYAALFGLLVARVGAGAEPARGAVGRRALVATGRRSLTCYLGQSVVFTALLPAWTLGLGAALSVWQAALLAIATWLLGVAVCVALDRSGRRGPAEVLLRRLTYGAGRPGVRDQAG